MTDLAEIFAELGISQYLQDFIDQGFDSWDIILDITESDFDILGVKLGHRRKLQRRIANSRGFSADRALRSPRNTPADEKPSDDGKVGAAKVDVKEGITQGAKRKYRRHPRADENAPERPPSAYVIFSNRMRDKLKGRNLSFTEIAKLVGENWQNLAPSEKEPYELQASVAKERYNNLLMEYKKTQNYRDYQQYFVEFKARQANQQRVSDLEVTKRPKLDRKGRTASNGSGSDEGVSVRPDVRSSASTPSQWHATNGHSPTSSSSLPRSLLNSAVATRQSPPQLRSATVLPGYRDSMFANAQQPSYWKDGRRDEPRPNLPGINSIGEGHSSSSWPASEALVASGAFQHSHRTSNTYPPPPLVTETTNRSTISSTSTSSSTVYTPSTPVDQDRTLPPFTVAFPSKPTEDRQMSPIRTPSLSSQSSITVTMQSPNGIHRPMEFPPIRPARAYPLTTPQDLIQTDPRLRDLISSTSGEDVALDPVSALLRAGEIVSRSSRSFPGPL